MEDSVTPCLLLGQRTDEVYVALVGGSLQRNTFTFEDPVCSRRPREWDSAYGWLPLATMGVILHKTTGVNQRSGFGENRVWIN